MRGEKGKKQKPIIIVPTNERKKNKKKGNRVPNLSEDEELLLRAQASTRSTRST